jgi:DNA polymerase III delta prime subunit
MMKSSKSGEGGTNDIFQILYGMMVMNLLESLFKNLPAFITAFQAWLTTAVKPKKDPWLPLIDNANRERQQLNSISMTRVFNAKNSTTDTKADNVYVEKVDAVIDFLCSLDSAKHVKIDTRYTLNSTDEIELNPLLKAKVKKTEESGEDGSIMEIVIFSSVLRVSEIRNWIDEIHTNYLFEKNNKLGNRSYYFNEVPVEPVVQMEMDPNGGAPKQTYRWDTMPKMLSFHMNEFNTSKSFQNVYGNHVDELKERLDLFINHPDWYMDRGIPHSLGILLHGVPGAGKTSTIKAIAKDTHRHIFNLSLRPYTSQRQLTNLFFNETVVIYGHDGNKQTLKIPLNRRVYVIEDIDCLTDVVLDRNLTTNTTSKDGDAVTLSFLLNLLDGVLETPGRILIITSNFPDKLDKALVRPGRIDVTIEFRNASREFILDMVNKFYNTSLTIDTIPIELETVFTPAEVMESLCTYFKLPEKAIHHMLTKHSNKQQRIKEKLSGTMLDAMDDIYPCDNGKEQTTTHNETVAKESKVSDEKAPEKASEKASEKVPKNEMIVGKPKPIQRAPMLQIQSDSGNYASALFEDAEFIGGGHLPGEFGTKVNVDLNMMAGR